MSTHSIAQQVQPTQWAPCYSRTNFIAASWELMCLQLTKMHHTKWNKERGDQLEDNSHPVLPPHTAPSLGHRMELEGTRGRRNTCKVWHVATGQARKPGSQSVAAESNKTAFPGGLKGTNRAVKRQKPLMCLSSFCTPWFKADGAVTSEQRLHV